MFWYANGPYIQSTGNTQVRQTSIHQNSNTSTLYHFDYYSSTSKMAIFLTGGVGKTSSRVASRLQDAKIPFVLGSRRGASAAPAGMNAVKFDWLDDSTYQNAFEHKFHSGEAIKAIYLVAPDVEDVAPVMNAYIDYCVKEQGVKRFVLMAGSSAEPGGWHTGKVWQHLLHIGVEYAVLRPSWFMGTWSLFLLCMEGQKKKTKLSVAPAVADAFEQRTCPRAGRRRPLKAGCSSLLAETERFPLSVLRTSPLLSSTRSRTRNHTTPPIDYWGLSC